MNCYDYPQYWDLAFQDETQLEADFIEEAARKYCDFPVRRMCEPGCGGGRLVLELARRGYELEAFDLSQPAIDYTRQRLQETGLQAHLQVADMRQFHLDAPVDLAFNTMNTFRHLLTEADARQHLEVVAKHLRPGGIYILGFHLLPPDASLEDEEEWTEQQGETTVTMRLDVVKASREARQETLRFRMQVDEPQGTREFVSDYDLRMYTAEQFQALLASVPALELCDVYDFWYEIDEPLTLDDELGDCVFILRRRP